MRLVAGLAENHVAVFRSLPTGIENNLRNRLIPATERMLTLVLMSLFAVAGKAERGIDVRLPQKDHRFQVGAIWHSVSRVTCCTSHSPLSVQRELICRDIYVRRRRRTGRMVPR